MTTTVNPTGAAAIPFPLTTRDDCLLGALRYPAFARVTMPMLLAGALDDPWASPCSREVLTAGLNDAPIAVLELHPSLVEGKIGRMGFFQTMAEEPCGAVLAWFESCESQSGQSLC